MFYNVFSQNQKADVALSQIVFHSSDSALVPPVRTIFTILTKSWWKHAVRPVTLPKNTPVNRPAAVGVGSNGIYRRNLNLLDLVNILKSAQADCLDSFRFFASFPPLCPTRVTVTLSVCRFASVPLLSLSPPAGLSHRYGCYGERHGGNHDELRLQGPELRDRPDYWWPEFFVCLFCFFFPATCRAVLKF